ncbi:MAG TPA: hypothetical protein PKD70_04725 [Saprospiraceae bacterium]|nr:hypothetical protein [Saprospiraceae bacterium]HMP13161.1 hypothetical protein [Saprospiraceae bacterium]
MKPRLVLWGNNAQNERVLVALELKATENNICVYIFPEEVVIEVFYQQMMEEWRDGKPLDFPENHLIIERELSVTESLLPDDYQVERPDVVHRAQTEWHFTVLSGKVYETYQQELSELTEQISHLQAYDGSFWDQLRELWDKIQVQVRDRTLLKSHSDQLRNRCNELFARMKSLRSELDATFDRNSKDNFDKFIASIEAIEKKITDGLRLAAIFDELKELQRNFRSTKFSREHRTQAWERLDAAFKLVKEKRYGPEAGDDKSPSDRLQRRYEGLLTAIEKMERSIKRDQEELDFQNRRIERSEGQLEAQLRQAKTKMIEERIRSKEEKLREMTSTRTDLEQRVAQQHKKEEERKKIVEAKRLAQEKIAQEIKEREEALKEDAEKLAKAAESLFPDEKRDTIKTEIPRTETPDEQTPEVPENIVEKLEDLAEPVVDTAEDAIEQATAQHPDDAATPEPKNEPTFIEEDTTDSDDKTLV